MPIPRSDLIGITLYGGAAHPGKCATIRGNSGLDAGDLMEIIGACAPPTCSHACTHAPTHSHACAHERMRMRIMHARSLARTLVRTHGTWRDSRFGSGVVDIEEVPLGPSHRSKSAMAAMHIWPQQPPPTCAETRNSQSCSLQQKGFTA